EALTVVTPPKPVTVPEKSDGLSTANRLNQGIKTTNAAKTGSIQKTNPLATVENDALSFIFTPYSLRTSPVRGP
ncbi:MAG: hypothetical protein VX992_07415, partial [Acidobacteriota bacterium]|nr:hypothetical protein [Acidobacteriota bacterium]